MMSAKMPSQTLNISAVSQPLHARLPAQREVPPERLHWALRVSFQALLSPRAWFSSAAEPAQHS